MPKFQFFYTRGVSSSNIAEILSSKPDVLGSGLDGPIIPNFNFFKDVARCNDDTVIKAYQRNPLVFKNDFQSLAARNLAVLQECGVLKSNIMSRLVNHPIVFTATHEKFKRIVEEEKKLGFQPVKDWFPCSSMFCLG